MSILIKKYSNRRLYHTEEKRYITLEDIAKIIQQGKDVNIIDNDSKKDITEETLLQIIVNDFQGLFSSSLLHQMIRLQSQEFQEFLPFYMRTGLEYYININKQMDLWKQTGTPGLLADFFPFFKAETKKKREKKTTS